MEKADWSKPAPKAMHRHADNWTRYCREYIVAKQTLCQQIISILRAHPDNPQSSLQQVQISESHVSETLVKLESMHFETDTDSDIPLVPDTSPTSSCCCSPPGSPLPIPTYEESETHSKIKGFLKGEYRKICESLKYKFHKIFPPKEALINSMIYDVTELEYNLKLLEAQCDTVQRFSEKPGIPAAILRRRTFALVNTYVSTRSHYERVIDCNSSDNKKLKKYVHDKLTELENQRSDGAVAECSGGQDVRSSPQTSKETTPKKRFTRSSAPAPQKQTPKHSAKEDPPGQPPSKRTPKHSTKAEKLELASDHDTPSKTEGYCITRGNRNDANFSFLIGQSNEDSSETTESTTACDSFSGMALTGSEDKQRSTGARPKTSAKKDLVAESKEVATTRSRSKEVAKSRSPSKSDSKKTTWSSPFKSRHDSKTGTPKKSSPKSPSRSKGGYRQVPTTDSDSVPQDSDSDSD